MSNTQLLQNLNNHLRAKPQPQMWMQINLSKKNLKIRLAKEMQITLFPLCFTHKYTNTHVFILISYNKIIFDLTYEKIKMSFYSQANFKAHFFYLNNNMSQTYDKQQYTELAILRAPMISKITWKNIVTLRLCKMYLKKRNCTSSKGWSWRHCGAVRMPFIHWKVSS